MLLIKIIFDQGSFASYSKLGELRYMEFKYLIKTFTQLISSISFKSYLLLMLFLISGRIFRSEVASGSFWVRELMCSIQVKKFGGPQRQTWMFSLLTKLFMSSLSAFSCFFLISSSFNSSCLLLSKTVLHLLRALETLYSCSSIRISLGQADFVSNSYHHTCN